jgi:predicted RNA-binding protein YlxR (DUF448 family)/ribosomal protein L30E
MNTAQRSRPTSGARRAPERTCAGCRKAAAPAQLLRVVRGPDGSLVPDLAQGAFGRGAWVHADVRCIERAAPRGFAASFKAPVATGAAELHAALQSAADQRVWSLIGLARRAGKLALGAKAVEHACKSEAAELLVVATDARAAGEGAWLESAVRSGRAAAYGTKVELGAALGRKDVGVVAVLDAGLSRSLSAALAVRALPAPRRRHEDSGVKEVS